MCRGDRCRHIVLLLSLGVFRSRRRVRRHSVHRSRSVGTYVGHRLYRVGFFGRNDLGAVSARIAQVRIPVFGYDRIFGRGDSHKLRKRGRSRMFGRDMSEERRFHFGYRNAQRERKTVRTGIRLFRSYGQSSARLGYVVGVLAAERQRGHRRSRRGGPRACRARARGGRAFSSVREPP